VECATSSGVRFQIDDSDAWVLARKWQFSKRATGNGYIFTKFHGKTVYLHRLLTNAPKGLEVDHVNRDSLDNRRANLRLVTHSRNELNKSARRTSRSGLRGVEACRRGNFRAYHAVGGRQVTIGTFSTAEEAFAAYTQAMATLGVPTLGER
jgi:hypothetical protein